MQTHSRSTLLISQRCTSDPRHSIALYILKRCAMHHPFRCTESRAPMAQSCKSHKPRTTGTKSSSPILDLSLSLLVLITPFLPPFYQGPPYVGTRNHLRCGSSSTQRPRSPPHSRSARARNGKSYRTCDDGGNDDEQANPRPRRRLSDLLRNHAWHRRDFPCFL